MTPHKDYRTRAAHVRKTARAHLKEIRRARLARTASTVTKDPATPLANEGLEDALTQASAPEPEAQASTLQETQDTVESAALEELSDMFDLPAPEEPVEPEMAATLRSAEVTDVSCNEPAEDIAKTPIDADAPQPFPTDEQAEPDPTPDLENRDLNPQPGAGPGLVWMLHQCGVSSLAELAASDPDDLTPKLGVVGQILDVSKWIDFAAQEASTSSADG